MATATNPSMSTWQSNIQEEPEDKVFAIVRQYQQCQMEKKVLLGVGEMRRELDGEPLVLEVVTRAKKQMAQMPPDSWTHEYQPMCGNKAFICAAQKLAFGESLASKLVQQVYPQLTSIQTISGSGACSLACHFLQRFATTPILYIPNPTWICHSSMATHARLEVREYRFLYDRDHDVAERDKHDCWVNKSRCNFKPRLDFDGMLGDLSKAPIGSAVLLHLCCHNPTGIDLTIAQWHQVAKLCQRRNLIPFFDNAYQGFASGDLQKDATPLRLFVEDYGLFPLVACSFSKIMGLYGERVGILHVVTPPNEDDTAKCCQSQLELLARCQYSSPPAFGAMVASRIMEDDALRRDWEEELRSMFQRINKMRVLLRKHLEGKMGSYDWSHITDQVGMFSYSGLSEEQVKHCAEAHGVFMLPTGRMCIAGLNDRNVEYTADAIVSAINECPIEHKTDACRKRTKLSKQPIVITQFERLFIDCILPLRNMKEKSATNVIGRVFNVVYVCLVLTLIIYVSLSFIYKNVSCEWE